MRKHLKDRHEVAHYWANKVQSEGEAGNVFFRDSTIYSYGTHFAIAKHLPDGSIAFTSRDYSPSTGQHKSIVRSAIADGVKLHFVPYPNDGITGNREQVDRIIKQRLESAAKRRVQKSRDSDLAGALHIAENFNSFALAMGAKKKGLIKIDALVGLDLDKLKAKLKRDEEAKERAAKALAKKREIEQQQQRAAWRHGGYGHFDNPIMLRLQFITHSTESADMQSLIKGEPEPYVIETSRGAEIPVEDAKRLWPVIMRCRDGDKDYEVGMELGHYRLTKIRTDGSIVVGCHDIQYTEIEGIAEKLGLVKEVAA
ncbi:MAG: hypothetical protein ACSLE8_06250 [Rhodococcus sp. (in: high G+C Gram-positive bacteria)]